MSQRVRYTKLTGDTIQSVRTYVSGLGINLRVLIDTKALEFALVDDKNNVISSGKGGYIHETKIKAKEALQLLGVSFSNEKRDKTEENV